MSEQRTWTAQIDFTETPDRTDAVVTVTMGDSACMARGSARRNPNDPNVPRIGEELAAARAFHELSSKLVEESARILEEALGEPVELYS